MVAVVVVVLWLLVLVVVLVATLPDEQQAKEVVVDDGCVCWLMIRDLEGTGYRAAASLLRCFVVQAACVEE